MSLLAPPTAYFQIEDRIDAIGQKYRVQKILRGAMLWIIAMTAASFAAALLAHVLGQGGWTRFVLIAWCAWAGFCTWQWFLRPLLIRPDLVEVARFIESRIDGLHNGLTNGLLLSRREDLAQSPWLAEIFNEIAATTGDKPLGDAIRIRDLLPLSIWTLCIVIPLTTVALIFPNLFFQGWHQLLAPATFVPKTGAAKIVKVQPGDVKLPAGQPLVFSIIAQCEGSPQAKVIFANASGGDPAAKLPNNVELASQRDKQTGDLLYSGRTKPLDHSMRYRVEVAGTQSDWFNVTVIRDQLVQYELVINLPDYISQAPQRMTIKAADVAASNITVPQGSVVEMTVTVEAPMGGAVLNAGKLIQMRRMSDRKFMATFPVLEKIQATFLPVPDKQLTIGCTMDQKPTIEMTWPVKPEPVIAAIDGELKIQANLGDDYGVASARVLWTVVGAEEKNKQEFTKFQSFAPRTGVGEAKNFLFVLPIEAKDRRYGNSIQVQLDVTDNRNLDSARLRSAGGEIASESAGPQTVSSAVYTFKFKEPDARVKDPKETSGNLLERLTEMLKLQRELHVATMAAKPEDRDAFLKVGAGQVRLREMLTTTAQSFQFEPDEQVVRTTLQKLASDEAKDAVDQATALQTEPADRPRLKLNTKLQGSQSRIIEELERLLLRKRLAEMLRIQKALHDQTLTTKLADRDAFTPIASGQAGLRAMMKSTVDSFHFAANEMIVRNVLLKLHFEEAKSAFDESSSLRTEPSAAARHKLAVKLYGTQRHIIEALEMLLANLSSHPTTQPSNKEGNDPLVSAAERLKNLNEALKEYMKKEQQILDQTTSLAKKPVDNWDDASKKKLEELKMAQEKLDAFMKEKIHDFSKNSEQDMANSSLLKQLMEIYSETTMAKDALKQKAVEIAVAAEENGIDNAKSLTSNIEKWLANAPDRVKWTQEDPLSKTDLNMPELPKELEDLVGKLLEQQEDLFEEMEDANANWAGSFDKGIGWDAADGPIASMNAQGVTGNQLPNNNEMNGRSGEGRSGKSSGEFVEDHATGKGGRNTPTRLDPTPFQKGQVKDDSKDPTGGATGGGKTSGQGGEGLQGPVGPKQKMEMERLAQKQAQLRNEAERLSLNFHVGKYDNFKLDEAIALMRRIESDIRANRYRNAMRKRDITLDALDSSRLLTGSEVHVQRDTTPNANKKSIGRIHDAKNGESIPGWKESTDEFFRKLDQQ